MRASQRLTIARRLNKHNPFASPKLMMLGLMVTLVASALIAHQRFAVTAQQQSEERHPAIQLTRIAEGMEGAAGIAHHQPTDSLLLSANGRAELFGADGARTLFSRAGIDRQSRLTTVRESLARHGGFTAGEIFFGTDAPGAIARVSPDGSRAQNPWVVLPGEIGLVRDLYPDRTEVFNGDLIAVTTGGGVWRIDASGNAQRVTPMITARSEAGEEAPVAVKSVVVPPNDPAKYGAWAGKILAVARHRGVIYAVDADGGVESFDPGISQINNILIIPPNENFFGIAVDRPTTDQKTDHGTIWGAPASDFTGFAGDLLITQAGGETCHCQPALWRLRWNGAEFQTARLGQLSGVSETTEWGQVTFSSFGAELLQQQATPLVGPFGQPFATGPTGNNDDFTLQEIIVQASGGATTATANARFINTLRNVGTAAGNFIVSAPTIPPGFTVSVSSDSGATFTSLNSGGTSRTPTPVNPNEERNLDVRITAPAGLAINTSFDVAIQVTSDTNAALFNRTIDRIRLVPSQLPQPMLTLVKSVRDVNGGLVLPGDTLEYSLTLSNASANPVVRSFITEFIPANAAYVAGSVRITAGANAGAKTDAIDGDQADFFSPVAGSHNGQINIGTGTGAGGHNGNGLLIGGTLAPADSTTVTFQVRVNAGLDSGAIISNLAFWGGNDIERAGSSNTVTSTVSAPAPLVGPFGQPAAVGPTGNNDDFTRGRVSLDISGGLTTVPATVRFINTLRNDGAAPGKFVVTAPTAPPGFSLRVSVDSGASFVSLDRGGAATTPTEVNPGEERNLDVRIELPAGLAVNTDYDVVIQVSREDAPTKFNRTIDRIRPDPNAPNLTLVKAVRDLNGNDIAGGTAQPGQTIEYTLTLRNAGPTPVANTFIAEYLPPNVSYVAGSTRITAGPNAGAKTDARGDDQVDYFPSGFVNGQINIFTGAGATALRGGTLAPGESTTVAFRVTVNSNATAGTVIRNGADWGAEDFFVGGKSNIVTVTVGVAQMAAPLLGPFGQPAAAGPTNNNDDFTLSRVNLNISGGLTTVTGTVRFINTLRNAGDIPGRFVISAVPPIPPGFSVRISVDSGATFVSLDSGGTATLPSDMNPGEERNLDVRVDLPMGLAVNTNFDLVLQASLAGDPAKLNRTIDRVRPDPNAPNLTLVKAVRDLNGNDIAGGTVRPGQTIEYTLTLRNAGTTPVANTFIAEYLPPNVTYVANSTRIRAGANAGAKTDARGDDQVDYFPSGFVNGQINITTGAGATALRGGTLAPGESTTAAFRVTINANVARGTVIRNGADWGAEDFGIGGKSNIVEVTVGDPCPVIVVGPPQTQIAAGRVGAPYSQTFIQTGGAAPVTFSSAGDPLPPGLTLNATTGVLAGTPAQAGTFQFTITATDANGCTGSQTFSVVINPSCPAITLSPAAGALPAGRVGATYSQTFAQSGGAAPVTFTVTAGALPPGLTLGATSGILAGVPTQTGAFTFTITARDANGCTGSAAYTLVINPAGCPVIVVGPPQTQIAVGRVGSPYSQTFTQTGGTLPVTFSSTGALPPGLTLNATTGVLAGTPAQAGTFQFTITATDANGCTGSQIFRVVINPHAR